MSILCLEITDKGILMAADRNITRQSSQPTRDRFEIITGQSRQRKVLKWQNGKAIVGYVGCSKIGGINTDEWLESFIGRNIEFEIFEVLASSLCREVEAQRRVDEGADDPQQLMILLVGFDIRDSVKVPVVWYVTNCHSFDRRTGQYGEVRKEYLTSEQFLVNYSWAPSIVKEQVKRCSDLIQPIWFHHGNNLASFNVLEYFNTIGIKRICDNRAPTDLKGWEKIIRFKVLMFGAYYEAFNEPFEQYVGGGADVVSLPWPE